ncbi:hypothetical protein HZS_7539 [Henneguya salminicola]|nr:hypothetical protein HZS_7539 [Henneguya salminicola]
MLIESVSKTKIILGYETSKEKLLTTKTQHFNKQIKNKGKYIHNSTFSYILGHIDQTEANILYFYG